MVDILTEADVQLFPAHAGVILIRSLDSPPIDSIPRPRGGDPKVQEFIARVATYSPPTRG